MNINILQIKISSLALNFIFSSHFKRNSNIFMALQKYHGHHTDWKEISAAYIIRFLLLSSPSSKQEETKS